MAVGLGLSLHDYTDVLLPDGHVRLPIAVQLDHVPMCVCVSVGGIERACFFRMSCPLPQD